MSTLSAHRVFTWLGKQTRRETASELAAALQRNADLEYRVAVLTQALEELLHVIAQGDQGDLREKVTHAHGVLTRKPCGKSHPGMCSVIQGTCLQPASPR